MCIRTILPEMDFIIYNKLKIIINTNSLPLSRLLPSHLRHRWLTRGKCSATVSYYLTAVSAAGRHFGTAKENKNQVGRDQSMIIRLSRRKMQEIPYSFYRFNVRFMLLCEDDVTQSRWNKRIVTWDKKIVKGSRRSVKILDTFEHFLL